MNENRNINGKQNSALNNADRADLTSQATAKMVDRASGGDLEAFGELYRLYLDQIYRYIYYRVKDRMQAEDITEEVFLKAWKAIKSCKGKGPTFLPWLYRIAHNQVVDSFRSWRRKSISLEEGNITANIFSESSVEANMRWQEVTEVIASLPPKQEQVITLKFIEGMSNPEIAEIMDKSEGAIRVLQMRALASIRRAIKEEQAGK
jgi:RNA polymerase sigma-70 factor (ECF subfamily)